LLPTATATAAAAAERTVRAELLRTLFINRHASYSSHANFLTAQVT